MFFEDSNSVTANYQSVIVYNPIGVTFENCRAVNSGSITTACNPSYSTALGDIWYIGNYFENVDASSVLVRVNGSNIVENINIIGNTFKAVSPTLDKYCITIGNHQTATSGGIVRNVTVKGNTARLTDPQCDGFIIVGDAGGNLTECSDVTISGNTADFRDSSGALITTGNTNQRGIWAIEVDGLSITGNTVRGTQSFGIGVDGCTGFSVGNNVVTECLRNASANANESAIYFNDSHTINCARGIVSDNTVIDSGAGGTVHAGIGSNALATITDILVVGNNTEDTRGTPGMTYGYRFSSSNSRIVYGTNKTRGAATSDYNGAGVITYTPSNVTTDRAFDANAAAGAITSPPTQAEVENIRDAVLELADVVGTLIADFQGKGSLQ